MPYATQWTQRTLVRSDDFETPAQHIWECADQDKGPIRADFLIADPQPEWDDRRRDAFLNAEWRRLSSEGRPVISDTIDPGPQPMPLLPIEEWWLSTARTDLDSVLPKMQEYGSYDLVAVGRLLAHAMQWDDATDAQLSELGCWFYLQGKAARAFDALRQHRLPSDDTTYDIGVYSMMIRRIREVGAWK